MAYIEVVTTSDNKAILQKIATILVKKRLAACVQVLGQVDSTYKWKGKLVHAREWMCVIKTTKSAYKKVESEIIKNHNYSLPQITAINLAGGSKSYLDWIGKGVK